MGRSWRLRPLAFDECEPARRRNEKIDLAAVVVAVEVDLAAEALIREVPDDLTQHVSLEDRSQHRASNEVF